MIQVNRIGSGCFVSNCYSVDSVWIISNTTLAYRVCEPHAHQFILRKSPDYHIITESEMTCIEVLES